jgi:hypothetical protein
MRNPARIDCPAAVIASLALAVLLVGCGEGDDEDDSKTYTLDTGVGGSRGGGTGDTSYRFGPADGAATPTDATVVVADAGSLDDVAVSETVSSDGTSPAPDIQADSGGAISSCFSHCGIFLEDNPCHCHHGCDADGNCCKDFKAMCSCQDKADCDDGLFCTIDNCFSGLCKQIPLPPGKCCDGDAACDGGDACNLAKCIDGACKLIAKDCDDELPCTVDVCEPDKGTCSNTIHPNKCKIDGVCAASGDAEPGSDGCNTCQPKVAPKAWTAQAGSCFIDGKCIAAGESPAGSSGTCRHCDPDASASAWSIKSGTCYINKVCYSAGSDHPDQPGCALCSPAKTKDAWTGKPGKCAVDGVCYDDGDPAPGGAKCGKCDATKSTSAFTVDKGICLVDGACHKHGDKAANSFGCQVCDATKAQTAWTVAKGKDCSDDDPCTVDTLCTAAGTCKGKKKGACCKEDSDCDGNPVGDCEKSVCAKGLGECKAEQIKGCCTSGVCCDKANKILYPASTKCSNFAIGSSQYKCEGNQAFKRQLFPGCDGVQANKCSQLHPAAGQWALYKTCPKGQVCALSSQTSPPACK